MRALTASSDTEGAGDGGLRSTVRAARTYGERAVSHSGDLVAGRSRKRRTDPVRGRVNAEEVVLGTVTLPGLERSVADARGFLRGLLAPGEVLDDLTLVVSELVCNAITHTRSRDDGKVTVTLVQGSGVLLLEVTDDGADGARPVLKDEDGGESGRGIRVVDALASRWAFRQDPDHTTVWAEFDRRT